MFIILINSFLPMQLRMQLSGEFLRLRGSDHPAAVTGMEEAVRAGSVNGMTAGTLTHNDNATMVQAAVMIYKLLAVLGKQGRLNR